MRVNLCGLLYYIFQAFGIKINMKFNSTYCSNPNSYSYLKKIEINGYEVLSCYSVEKAFNVENSILLQYPGHVIYLLHPHTIYTLDFYPAYEYGHEVWLCIKNNVIEPVYDNLNIEGEDLGLFENNNNINDEQMRTVNLQLVAGREMQKHIKQRYFNE
ncbi:hypothetical protein QTP88_007709 [Uroleucon formosanum]